ncbi:MAG: hypothetical protein KTR31_29530 [Myxococcales bacterium]|nr:hypothetical protein [Myxococcales bacterium]
MTAAQRPLPSVVFVLPDERRVRMLPGDVLGRGRRSDVVVQDPRVSEAHAMVSLRRGGLWWLPLRPGVHGQVGPDVLLAPGASVTVLDELQLRVESLTLPATVDVLQVDHGAPIVLDHPEWHIAASGDARPGPHREAVAVLWRTDGRWWCRGGEGPARQLAAGVGMVVGGRQLHLGAVPSDSQGSFTADNQPVPPVRIRSWEGFSEVGLGSLAPVRLTGNPHRVFRLLARLVPDGGTVHWQEVASRLWPHSDWSSNWYTNLPRIREQLRKKGLPGWLLVCENGQVGLGMRQRDRVELRDPDLP